MAYLESELGAHAYSLPLTGFRHGVGGRPDLTREEVANLHRHFDKFVPHAPIDSSRKKILLVDFAFGGKSLASAHHYVRQYLELYHPHLSVDSLGLALASETDHLKKEFKDIDFLALRNSTTEPYALDRNDHLLLKMSAKLYKEQSEYLGFSPRETASVLAVRPQYVAYIAELRTARDAFSAGKLDDVWIAAYAEISKSLSEKNPTGNVSKMRKIKDLVQENALEKTSDDIFVTRFNQIISDLADQMRESRLVHCLEEP